MPILLGPEAFQSHDSPAEFFFRAGKASSPQPGIPDGLTHQVGVRAVTSGDVVDYFVVCGCGFVSGPSVWRPQHVSPRDCEVAELFRRIARNRACLNRSLVAEGESVIHVE